MKRISCLTGFFFVIFGFSISWATDSMLIAQADGSALAAPTNLQIVSGTGDGTTPTPDVPSPTIQTTSVSQHGITWTFANPVESGQFVNGDYWVIDPGDGVKIVNISPGHTSSPRHMNGSMINPSTAIQGYDGFQNYSADLNVGIGVSAANPLILYSKNSLVSTISNPSPGGSAHVSYVKAAAVLTCLQTPPAVGSFRPGISSSAKTLHNFGNVNQALLTKLESPTTRPNIATYQQYFQMVWLTHNPSWTGRYMLPSDGIPNNYYYPSYFSTAALMLLLDYTDQEKEVLLINFLQVGIDIYSFIEAGSAGWPPDGGHSMSRKWPILFAGLMLDYSPMKNIGQRSGNYLYANGHGPGNFPPGYIHFGEDGQTFYVTQTDVDLTNSASWNPDVRSGTPYPYTSSMIGMPEWGIRYSTHRNYSDSAWYAIYRTIGSGAPAWAGTALAARIMGAKTLWNYDAHFDYVDRYMAISRGNRDPFGFTVVGERTGNRPGGLIGAMWDTYRSSY